MTRATHHHRARKWEFQIVGLRVAESRFRIAFTDVTTALRSLMGITNTDDLIVSRHTIAEALCIDVNGAVSKLTKQNILVRVGKGEYALLASVRRYCRHQRQKPAPHVAKRSTDDDETDDAADGDIVARLSVRAAQAVIDGQSYVADDLRLAVQHIHDLRRELRRAKRLYAPLHGITRKEVL